MSDKFCTTCGAVAKPISVTKGSIVIELFLWCCFLLPGLLYSLWRLSSRHTACRVCKGTALVPLDSPVARKALPVQPASTLAPTRPA
jgi:hypothetical protein